MGRRTDSTLVQPLHVALDVRREFSDTFFLVTLYLNDHFLRRKTVEYLYVITFKYHITSLPRWTIFFVFVFKVRSDLRIGVSYLPGTTKFN